MKHGPTYGQRKSREYARKAERNHCWGIVGIDVVGAVMRVKCGIFFVAAWEYL